MHRSRGRRSPAHRRLAPPQAETGDRRAPGRGTLRQLMVTPTFVFSVTILTMAILAFGTTQTYLRFSAGPDSGCGTANGCARPDASHTADSRGPGGAMTDGTGHSAALPSGSSGAGAGRQRSMVKIAYRTMRALPTGFLGVISITSRGGLPPRDWWLSVQYPGVQITSMVGATWHVDADGNVIIQPLPQTPELRPGSTLPITFSASGQPGAPSGCRFDGVRCHISR